MKIISWNLLHRSGATMDQVTRLIDHDWPDLLLMQEAGEMIDALPQKVGGYYFRNVLPGRRHGLAAWSSKPFCMPPSILDLQPGVIVQRVCQIIETERFSVANVHLSHGQLLNRRQLKSIAQAMPYNAAIIGDCNMVGPAFLSGFRDVGPRQPTHTAGFVVQLRLDRCFVRGVICGETAILSQGNSDHRPIVVNLSV